ncbi:MAG: drug/metabolite transporter (DMT)-like permease [Candidatus Krumholzibacteriia bacterium]|jgi:drug/metabolite transporter (DMT)-like permease
MIYLLAASLLWAFSFGLIKTQLAGLDPVTVACARLLLASIIFLPWLCRDQIRRDLIPRAMGLGVIQFGLMYVFYITSYTWLDAWQVALFTIFTPLYVVLLADANQDRFHAKHLIAAIVAVVGAAFVNWSSPLGADWRGVLVLQAANICFAWGQLRFGALRRDAGGRDAALVGWMTLGAFIMTFLTILVRSPGDIDAVLDWQPTALWSILYLGVVPTGLGFYLWNRGAARTPDGLLAVANNLKVPLAVIVSWTVFGEEAMSVRLVLGLAVIVVGLWWVRPKAVAS